MATRYWKGSVSPRSQVVTITVTAYDAATTYIITIGVNQVSVVGSGGTTTTVATALVAALQATDYPEFQEVSWTSSGAVITGVANTPGVPFTATSSVSGGAGTIGAVTTTITNTSPNDVGDANNWSAATLPTSGDSVVVENTDIAMLWRCETFASTDIVSWIVRSSMTGRIGLPTYNDNGYVEYRTTTMQLQTCTTLYIEQADNLGEGEQKFYTGTNAAAVTVIGNGNGTLGEEVLWLSGANNSNTLENNGGSVAVAALDSDTATIATLNATDGSVTRCGLGVTFNSATVKATNSTLDLRSNVTTLTVDGSASSLTCWNTMTVTTLSLTSPCVYNSSGTITTLNLYVTDSGDAAGVGSIDFSQDRTARTITNTVNMYRGTTFNDPNTTVTLSATPKIQMVQCRYGDVTIDRGINVSI